MRLRQFSIAQSMLGSQRATTYQDCTTWYYEKNYSKEDNTWELVSVIQYLRRLLSTFHKKHLKKSTATLPPVNLTPPTTKPIVKHKSLNNKQKCD